MGSGSYGYSARRVINAQSYSDSVSREEVFSQTRMSDDMNIKNKVRECRNSEEHPAAFPIIIALDVTGSMGHIPDTLIRTGLPDIMEKILESGVKDPQVCFMAIGDQYSDVSPIQVGQFESSDELMDKWLKLVWLEGRGGGNSAESYQLAWYAAYNHTACDWIDKDRKGVLITIGDDGVHRSISRERLLSLFGHTEVKSDLSTSDLYNSTKADWDIWHINVSDYQGQRDYVKQSWEFLGDHLVNTEDSQGSDIPQLIAGVILQSYKKQTGHPEVVDTTINSEVKAETVEPEHLL